MAPIKNLVENSYKWNSYKWIGAVLGVSIILMLSACASSPDKNFAGVVSLDAKNGDLYLYQTSNPASPIRENGKFDVVQIGRAHV